MKRMTRLDFVSSRFMKRYGERKCAIYMANLERSSAMFI